MRDYSFIITYIQDKLYWNRYGRRRRQQVQFAGCLLSRIIYRYHCFYRETPSAAARLLVTGGRGYAADDAIERSYTNR